MITPSLITPKRAATRQRLLTAAGAIIAERGLHGATVEEISAAAGFIRGACYSNFADKEEQSDPAQLPRSPLPLLIRVLIRVLIRALTEPVRSR